MKHARNAAAGIVALAAALGLGTSAFGQVATPGGSYTGHGGGGGVNPQNGTSFIPNMPKDNSGPYNQAVNDYNAGHFDEAARDLRDDLKVQPDSLDAHMLYGYVLLRQNKYAEALPHLELVAKQTPNDPVLHDNLGVTYLQLQRPADAAAQFKSVLAHAPKDKAALAGLAQATGQTIPSGQSVSDLQKAVSVHPTAAGYEDLGDALQNAGKAADAADAFRKAADMEPKNSEAWLLAGALYEQAGQNNKAIPALQQVLTLNNGHVYNAHVHLGEIYAASDKPKAIAEFQQAAQLRPTDAATWYNLGVLQAAAGHTANARADYQKVLDLRPADASLSTQARAALAALPAKQPPTHRHD